MADIDHLFKQYIADHRAGGEADPLAYLDRTAEADRTELAGLIDGYLSRAPRQAFDAEKFAASTAASAVDALSRSLGGQAGLWPSLLPRLRERARLKRADVVERLTESLGAAGRETKVARYYHEMEQGSLPSEGVSSRVLEALGAIVGESAQALREAGRVVGGGRAPGERAASAVFARAVPQSPAAADASPAEPPALAEDPWDEIDELFTAG